MRVLPTSSTGSGSIVIQFGQWLSGATTDNDSLYSQASVTSGTSLGTPTTHSSLKGTISILSEGGDLSSTNFTITGTDMAGNVITEQITGPTSEILHLEIKFLRRLQMLFLTQL